MARERSLLERVAASRDEAAAARYAATAADDPEARMESVRRHLTKLLNARQGMCEADPDYGLPALTDLLAGGAECERLTQDANRATIETAFSPTGEAQVSG